MKKNHHENHRDMGITPCLHCGAPLGHNGKGLPCAGEQMENLIAAMHNSIKSEVNRAGAVHTGILAPAAIEVMLDVVYKEAMFDIIRLGAETREVEKILKEYEEQIHTGFTDLWQQVLERTIGGR